MDSTSCVTTAGVFTTREAANRAIAELKAAGYRDDQIGLVAKDTGGSEEHEVTAYKYEIYDNEALAIGAASGVTGAVGGAVVAAGVLSGAIPVIGPILAIGTLGTVLLNTAVGAVSMGVVGALLGWGIPRDEASFYEDEVAAGKYLVTVECGYGDDARDLLERHGGYVHGKRAM
ncbi:hypothetical protein [Fimbriiglobus ruber]|uniref:Signal Transduction Histidine Kinase (STHK), LytS n=1 Tax=Fimbriiglobus ruber TaxID=1908690 RepID=A0A225E4G3_9BACT|nr:hypothetical protein [Fimbriiglobus ruber]OWK43297.1 Signal Transduction Histidine Kinase (STHK), LytS [Fimbriiglobus ruber]